LQVRELVQLKIESLNYSVNAVGKANGFVVFVPCGVPGDTLLTRIIEIKRNYAIGEMVEMIDPSPYRCQPSCVHFSEGCGGCQWQHIAYDHQLEWKKDIIRQALQRIGKMEYLPEIEVYSEQDPLHYRNKLRLFPITIFGKMLLGMKKHNTHKVIPINECSISSYTINDIISTFQRELSSSESSLTELGIKVTDTNQVMLTCTCAKNNRSTKALFTRLSSIFKKASIYSIINDKLLLEHGTPTVTENVSGKSYLIGPDSFFQVNRYGLKSLIDIAKECMGLGNKLILDAHCGVGTFALQIADACDEVWGIDISSTAIELADQNAVENQIDNAFFRKGSAVRILNSRLNNEKLDAVILDPPRDGCDKLDLLAIINSQPEKILYISCNPTTLARDLREICNAGYKLLRLAMVDMFPMTYHLETVAFCVRE
jgi:23S rRNA (uracil1939-C5)-methyltransferase